IAELYLKTGDNPVKEDFVDLSLRVDLKATDWLGLFVRGENLTNKRYRTMLGFPMPGALFFGGVSIKL
ncbi:MAG: TonB-dependent receptor, partial [Bacteroidales bacterium]|nr:TonB-dependent receptor [Bacteroidales bacterium]